jgi:predicted dehydrogenase
LKTGKFAVMVKIGLIGAGHLGKIHLRLLNEIEGFELIGFYDADQEKSSQIESETGIKSWPDIESLILAADALDIVTPTTLHFSIASLCLRKQKHIFIEKPVTTSPEEGKDLVRLAQEAKVKVQVGHVERFNPAMLALQGYEINPKFIECHRLAQWNPRGTDVSVVQDLMIHDIDLVQSLVRSPVKRVSASGVAVLSDSLDIANARIEFSNGAVANLTTSRISIKNMRKMRIFQNNGYLSLDFLDKRSELFFIEDPNHTVPGQDQAIRLEFGSPDRLKNLLMLTPESPSVNAIKMELEEFLRSIRDNAPVRVSLEDGVAAVETAALILERIQGS